MLCMPPSGNSSLGFGCLYVALDQWFNEVVSGRRNGLGALLARAVFAAAELPVRWGVRRRNRKFDTGQTTIAKVSVPVVSVGNLTLGGTGKTPMVEWIARWFRARQVRVTLISRGYRAEQGAANDEALELEQKLPDVPHVLNPRRAEAAVMAIEEFACQLIVLDDAFQHRYLHRDLDIVLLDATDPFGSGHVFPRGRLREPAEGLARAGCIVLCRADLVEDAARLEIRKIVQSLAPQATWGECIHAPLALRSADEKETPLNQLAGANVAAFCGIGNPAAFRSTLASCGCRIVGFREFPDHHGYERRDVESLAKWAASLDVEAVVCTHKDLVKIDLETLGERPLWALRVGLRFTSGQPEFERELQSVLEKSPPDSLELP